MILSFSIARLKSQEMTAAMLHVCKYRIAAQDG
jgi:hypothetical protein